jgi:hypothetical protein
MVTRKILAAAAVASLMATYAIAQTNDKENNGHHYQGGPKTEVPHHMGKKDTVNQKKSASGGHHYSGGPKTEVPHHMGEKN